MANPIQFSLLPELCDLAGVQALLDSGADVNAKDENDMTALHWAASGGNEELVELLISKGADVNAKEEVGWTPLHYAAAMNHKAIAELLLAKGADVNAKAKDGKTPQDFAYGATAELLLKHGGKSDSILVAARVGDLAGVQALLDSGADVNAKHENGMTPLHLAATWGHKEVAELLIDNGADVNAKEEVGWTPLHYAAAMNHKAIAELLLASDADVNAKANDGRTSIDFAYGATAELLLKHGGKSDSILVAARVGDLAGVQALLDSGADVNAKHENGMTPLHWTAHKGHWEIAELLIAKRCGCEREG